MTLSMKAATSFPLPSAPLPSAGEGGPCSCRGRERGAPPPIDLAGSTHVPSKRADLGLRTFARGQRGAMPAAEALFWQHVRGGRFQGWKFKRQVPVAPYVVDFLCIPGRLVVELDGPMHEETARRERDAKRDAWLTEQGFQVLRFPDDLVLSDLPGVLRVIGAALDWRTSCSGGAPLSRPLLTQGPPSPAEGRGT